MATINSNVPSPTTVSQRQSSGIDYSTLHAIFTRIANLLYNNQPPIQRQDADCTVQLLSLIESEYRMLTPHLYSSIINGSMRMLHTLCYCDDVLLYIPAADLIDVTTDNLFYST